MRESLICFLILVNSVLGVATINRLNSLVGQVKADTAERDYHCSIWEAK